MESIQFLGTTPQGLITEITNALIPALEQRLAEQFQPKQPTEYLTRKEVCEILQIDLSTLWRWQKQGIVVAYSVANRVYFKRDEIDQTITKNRI